jgi:hypothetical protein
MSGVFSFPLLSSCISYKTHHHDSCLLPYQAGSRTIYKLKKKEIYIDCGNKARQDKTNTFNRQVSWKSEQTSHTCLLYCLALPSDFLLICSTPTKWISGFSDREGPCNSGAQFIEAICYGCYPFSISISTILLPVKGVITKCIN